MTGSLRLPAPLSGAISLPSLPRAFTLRPPTPEDAPALAALSFAAHPAGVACATPAEAQEDIRATFAGE